MLSDGGATFAGAVSRGVAIVFKSRGAHARNAPNRAGRLATFALAFFAMSSAVSAQSLTWQGAERLAVLCLVAPSRDVDYRALQTDLCERVVREASKNAPLPVSEIAHGDPQVIASDTLTLLVHASIQPGPDHRPLVAIYVRPFRATTEQTSQLFSAPPVAAALERDGSAGREVDAAIAASLDQTLPWRAPRQAADHLIQH